MDEAQNRAYGNENEKSKLAFPHGSDWLLERLRSYDYQIDEINLCHSISWISLTSILMNDVSQLAHRLSVILNIKKENFATEMDAAKQKIMTLIIESRKQIRTELAKEFNLPAESTSRDFENGLDYYQKQHLNKMIHEEINRRKATGDNQKAHEIADVLSLLESLQLYQHSHAYSQLITTKSKNFHFQTFATPLHVPSGLQKEGGLIQIKLFTGIYTKNELITYFRSLRSILCNNPNFNLPHAFTLNDSKHTITVGFLDQNWIIIDSNDLDFNPIASDEETAEKIFMSFAYPHADSIILSSKIYATKKNAPIIEDCIKAWQSLPEYILIHK